MHNFLSKSLRKQCSFCTCGAKVRLANTNQLERALSQKVGTSTHVRKKKLDEGCDGPTHTPGNCEYPLCHQGGVELTSLGFLSFLLGSEGGHANQFPSGSSWLKTSKPI